ncbi:anti-sigma factor family protein [Reyranella sp.]|uniref:anti-sigma factor family protein n=1 Tax=Reyranella sp. TaxID=1929291 RepID=UPI003BAC67DE
MIGDDHPIGEDELQAYVDDRLEAGRRAAVEAHLALHPEVRERILADRRHRAALRAQLQAKADEPIPARLRIASLQAARRNRLWRRSGLAAAAVLLFVAGTGAGWLANDGMSETRVAAAPTAVIAQGATAAFRTFVVEVAHPVEVGAAQEAHLLQWLSKRLGRRLEAPDLGRFGFRLIGGRLLPADSSAAAQLMYEDATGRRLTVYVRAADGTETAFRFKAEGNTATFAWIDQGFGFAVTAMASRDELLPIAEAVYKGLTPKG